MLRPWKQSAKSTSPHIRPLNMHSGKICCIWIGRVTELPGFKDIPRQKQFFCVSEFRQCSQTGFLAGTVLLVKCFNWNCISQSHRRQDFENGSPNIIFPYQCWYWQRYGRFGLQEDPKKELASPCDRSAQILHQQQGKER